VLYESLKGITFYGGRFSLSDNIAIFTAISTPDGIAFLFVSMLIE